jgi:hypothetical protein
MEPLTSSSGGNKYSLLDAEQQNLLRILSLSSNEERVDIHRRFHFRNILDDWRIFRRAGCIF